jgi:transcriptional regulator with XRE-family HTH domain
MSNARDTITLVKLGNHIRKLRKTKNMTMVELAYAAEVEYKQICRIEKGETNATISTLLAIAKGLEINIDEIVKIFNTH